MTVYADSDESETSTDQSVKQKNTGSDDSLNFNCGQNLIKAGVGEQACGQEEEGMIVTDVATDTDAPASNRTLMTQQQQTLLQTLTNPNPLFFMNY